MTTPTGQVPPQHLMHGAGGVVGGAAQSAPGSQVSRAVQPAIGAVRGQGDALSLVGRVALPAAFPVQPLVDSLILATIQQCGARFLRDFAMFRDDPAIVLAAVRQNGHALRHASERLGNDPDIVLAAVQQNGDALQYASPRLRNDLAFLLDAVQQNGMALEYASPILRNDPAFLFHAVQQNGMALACVSPILRDDPDIVLAAVQQNGDALSYASARLQNNPDFLLAAAARNGLVLEFIPEALRIIEIACAAMVQNSAARRWVPEALIARAHAEIDANTSFFPFLPVEEITPDRAQRAIEVNPLFLQFVPGEIQHALNTNVITSAVRKNPEALKLIEPKTLLTEEIVNTVIHMLIPPDNEDLLNARDEALKNLANQVSTGVIDRTIAIDWMFGLARDYFNNDKEFMILAIAYHGVDLSVASERLRDDVDVVLEAVGKEMSDWKDASDRLRQLYLTPEQLLEFPGIV